MATSIVLALIYFSLLGPRFYFCINIQYLFVQLRIKILFFIAWIVSASFFLFFFFSCNRSKWWVFSLWLERLLRSKKPPIFLLFKYSYEKHLLIYILGKKFCQNTSLIIGGKKGAKVAKSFSWHPTIGPVYFLFDSNSWPLSCSELFLTLPPFLSPIIIIIISTFVYIWLFLHKYYSLT